MSDYDNTNRGALFKNERKEQPTHSDYNGTVNVDGKEFYLNAWLKESQGGKAYMSLSVKAKDAVKSNSSSASTSIAEEDVPF